MMKKQLLKSSLAPGRIWLTTTSTQLQSGWTLDWPLESCLEILGEKDRQTDREIYIDTIGMDLRNETERQRDRKVVRQTEKQRYSEIGRQRHRETKTERYREKMKDIETERQQEKRQRNKAIDKNQQLDKTRQNKY